MVTSDLRWRFSYRRLFFDLSLIWVTWATGLDQGWTITLKKNRHYNTHALLIRRKCDED